MVSPNCLRTHDSQELLNENPKHLLTNGKTFFSFSAQYFNNLRITNASIEFKTKKKRFSFHLIEKKNRKVMSGKVCEATNSSLKTNAHTWMISIKCTKQSIESYETSALLILVWMCNYFPLYIALKEARNVNLYKLPTRLPCSNRITLVSLLCFFFFIVVVVIVIQLRLYIINFHGKQTKFAFVARLLAYVKRLHCLLIQWDSIIVLCLIFNNHFFPLSIFRFRFFSVHRHITLSGFKGMSFPIW